MGIFGSQVRKKQRERARKQVEQANIRRVIGADVSDDSISVSAPAMKSAGEVAVGVLGALSRTILRIILFILCAAGLIAIIYPGPRGEMVTILTQTFEQIKQFLGI